MSEGQLAFKINPEFNEVISKVSELVHNLSGNRLGEKQAYMVETRVKKRMMELGIKTPNDYIHYLNANKDSESKVLVGLITTHHTFFFREFPHFEILKKLLPNIVEGAKKRGEKTIQIWSAACSRGQEAYSIALFLEYYLPQIDSTMSYKILGSDIDPESVKVAGNGVYLQTEIKEIPMNFMGNNWANGTGAIANYAKIKSHIKAKCEFKVGNLLKIKELLNNQKFDVIFCRNVFIYFENHQVETISKEIIEHLHDTGVFFSGISEPLTNFNLKLNSVGPSSYIHKKVDPQTTKAGMPITPASRAVYIEPINIMKSEIDKPIRVLCVDDSSSIISLLKKILTKENGFEVVAIAENGLVAMEKLKSTQVDIITLDIHMPEMDGITYLQKNYNKNHPPVVIISSASRDDATVAMKALSIGASDYVEKPALANFEERGEEIRTKLKTVMQDKERKPEVSSLDKETKKTYFISNPDDKLRIVISSISDLPKVKNFFGETVGAQPATLIFFEGVGEILPEICKEKKSYFKYPVAYYDENTKFLEANKIYFVDFKKYFQVIFKNNIKKPTSILAYGNISAHMAKSLSEWKGVQVLIEDLGDKGNQNHPMRSYSTDVVPVTSFPYMSCRYLSTK